MYNFEIIYKWDSDDSIWQAQYKQRFFCENIVNNVSDVIYFYFLWFHYNYSVMLKIMTILFLWKNPRPSSTRFIKIKLNYMFKKETAQTTTEELKNVEDQIKILVSTTITIDGNNFNLKHTLIFTMIDIKVIKYVIIIWV